MKHLTVENHNYVTTVTLNRVEKRNAMSLSMWQALGESVGSGREADDGTMSDTGPIDTTADPSTITLCTKISYH